MKVDHAGGLRLQCYVGVVTDMLQVDLLILHTHLIKEIGVYVMTVCLILSFTRLDLKVNSPEEMIEQVDDQQ